MIDLQDLRARSKKYEKAAKDKGIDVSIKDFLKLDEKRKTLMPEVEEMRAHKNEVSKKVPSLRDAERKKAVAEMKKLNEDLKKKEEALETIEKDWKAMQYELPAIPLDQAPIGKSEADNVEVEQWGDIPSFSFETKDHVSLGESLDIIDIPRGVKVSGARSYFLKGDGVRLHQAVLRYTMDQLADKGWTLFTPPHIANYDCFVGTGFFPGADQSNIYAVGGQENKESSIEADDEYLIGTSEVSVCGYHKDELLQESELPKRYAGYSVCFRREAGTYGKDTKGLYRVHQFEKVEQVVLCKADEDEALKMFKEIRANAIDVLQALQLPYRVLDICTGDPAFSKGKLYMQDIETWMPSRDSYGETHSCSYLGDFQARRLNIKYEDASGEKKFVHTLNNTCIASPRILIPILEMYQQENGNITIPDVLQPYMRGQKVIERR